MPRIKRLVARGYPHHITQRGNYQRPVFEKENDYSQYLEWLRKYSLKYELEIWAYCLMTNHVHFVCVPQRDDSLALTFNTLHMRHAQFVNRRNNARGHLWQGRFYSTILDEKHTYAAVRYVENNPVRAGIVKQAEDYMWSSARDHIDGNVNSGIAGKCYLFEDIKNWRGYLNGKEDTGRVIKIKKNLMTGRPSGSSEFVEKLQKKFKKRLTALPRGRPKLNKK